MPRPRKAAPPPPATATGRPHIYPLLQRFVDPAYPKGFTYRDQCALHFLKAYDEEERFHMLTQRIFLTWPQKFLRNVDLHPETGRLQWHVTESWNPWLGRLYRALTNDEYAVRQGDSVFRSVSLTGCAAAGKTHGVAVYAQAWWDMDPENSIVVLTSTTKDMIHSRVWSVIQEHASTAFDACRGEPLTLGNLVPSQMKLICPSGRPLNSISAYAVAHGETLKAIDNLKGLHAKRMLIVIDEANGTPEAIFSVLPNYRKGCLDLTVVILGNPVSRLDPHGRACKPRDGWPLAADEQQIEWQTEGVPDWELDSGVCLRFDGRDSPNVVAGRNRWPYLYTLDNWNQAQRKVEVGGGGTFAYWSFTRGMWPPDGASNVIFSEQLFLRCDAIGTHFEWETEKEPVAFLDSGFGGDSCILKFGFMGTVKGRLCLQITEELDVPIDPAAASHDIDYQIARRVQQECVVRRIKPYCFGLDATGTGRGVAAILASEWSPQILCVQWGGATTERASSQHDGRPAREVYSNFVTECWLSVREGLEAGQIKGFSNDDVTEFCSRLYEMKGKKMQAEPKPDMRLRVRYSPDRADAIVGLWEVCRRNGLEIKGALATKADMDWKQRGAALAGLVESGLADTQPEGGWAEPEEPTPAVGVSVNDDWGMA